MSSYDIRWQKIRDNLHTSATSFLIETMIELKNSDSPGDALQYQWAKDIIDERMKKIDEAAIAEYIRVRDQYKESQQS